MELQEALHQFEIYIAAEKILAQRSVETYKGKLTAFVNYLKQHQYKTVNEIDIYAIRMFLQYKSLNNQPRTISHTILIIKEFFNFLAMRYDLLNVGERLAIPKFERKLPTYFTEEQIETILEKLPNETIWDKRSRLMIEILYTTGVRVTELGNIKIDHFRFDERLLLIEGKGGRQRLVPILKPIMAKIKEYIATARKKLLRKKYSEYLFFNTNYKNKKLTKAAIASILRIVSKELNMKINAHKFRHSIATHLLKRGMSIRAIQQFLGHESITTTAIYIQINIDHLREAYDKYHPRA